MHNYQYTICSFFVCLAVSVPLSAEEAEPLLPQEEQLPRKISLVETHEPVIRRDDSANDTDTPDDEAEGEPQNDSTPETTAANPLAAPIPATESGIQNWIKAIRENEELASEIRDKSVANLEKALKSLRSSKDSQKRLASISDEIAAVPGRLEELTSELQRPLPPNSFPEIQKLSLQQVETRHAEVVASLEAARQTLQTNQDQATKRSEQRKQAQQELAGFEQQKEKLTGQLAAPLAEGIHELVGQTRRSQLTARLTEIEVRNQLLEKEVELVQAVVELQPLQHDDNRRRVARLEAEEAIWSDALSEKRDLESAKQLEDAKRKARETNPALSQLAAENQQLAELRAKYSAELDDVTSELSVIRDSADEESQSFQRIRDRVERIGMTEAIGHLLRAHQRKLINDRPLRTRARAIEDEQPQVELLTIQLTEQRNALWGVNEQAEIEAQKLLKLSPGYDKQLAYEMAYELLATKKDYLEDLRSDLEQYSTKLTELHNLLKETAKLTAEHRNYINEHVLWIRSANMVSSQDIQASREAIQELLSPAVWLQVVQDVGLYLKRHLVVWLMLLGLFAIGMVVSDRLKDRIAVVGSSKSVSAGSRFLPTLEAILETAFVASFLPGSTFLLSLYLTRFPEASSLEVSIGTGLRWTSLMWLGLSVLQQVCREGGLAEKHFGWHPRNINVIRRNVRLLVWLGLPAVFAVMIIETYREGDYVSSLGRLSFMGGMGVMALFTHRLLDPYRTKNGVWANPNVWMYRVRHAVYASCVFLPIALLGLAAAGYVYSAHQIAFRAQLSLWLILAVVLTQTSLGRYLQIARRNAALRHMQHRRSEQAEQAEPDIATDDEIDFQSIAGQMRRLLRGGTLVAVIIGMSLIWADMIPALKALDRVELWSVQLPDGTEGAITLVDALLAIGSTIATVMAARNLPGLLNITIFERLPIDYGTRYALTAVSRYLISLFGAVVAFQFIGVTWQSVQWLVAAMTVGLGFGLQEIFANFVSGLIIFTERPVRVGDMVTVGNITGKVTRVQIRATTITDFDRRELVVPNKRFITEDVINWTLSDPITRVILPVGISYDCDPDEARSQLLDLAEQHSLVLSEPEPTAVFIGFGDSTLDLELRVFIVGRDNVFQVQNELNLAINRAFKLANLEIAYPQRDLRIRSVDASVLPAAQRSAKAA